MLTLQGVRWLQKPAPRYLEFRLPQATCFLERTGFEAAVKATTFCGGTALPSPTRVCVSVNSRTYSPSRGVGGRRAKFIVAMSSLHGSDFIHLAVTHSKKYILHHKPAHPYMCKYTYLELKNSCSLNETALTFTTCCDAH